MAKRYHHSKKESHKKHMTHGHDGHVMSHRHHGVHEGVTALSMPEGHHGSVPHHSPLSSTVSSSPRGQYHMRDKEQYAGKEETRMMMGRDGAMIAEDRNATALLPTHVIDRDWPRAPQYDMGYTDTLFSGVQRQLKDDEEDMRRTFNPGKY